MRAFVLLALVSVSFSANSMSIDHPVPNNRQELKGEDWFPYVLSKIAPLERWRFAKSPDDLRLGDFGSEYEYQTTIEDRRSFPLFCFSLFRPKVDIWRSLLAAIAEQPGPIYWQLKGDCLLPSSVRWVAMAPLTSQADVQRMMSQLEELKRNPPNPDPDFSRKALNDIPRFCQYLEQRLQLVNKQPQQFDSSWLTKEGLSQHPPQYQDFIDEGDWAIALSKHPHLDWPKRTADVYLNFGIPVVGASALLTHLGANWESFDEGSGNPVLPQYPMLSHFDDVSADYPVSREQIPALIVECTKAQKVVEDKQSLRVLDLLLRAAHWAERQQTGLFFSGQ